MISNLEAVVFDMDGILFDTERLITDCWYEIGSELNQEVLKNAILACVGLNRLDTENKLKEFFGQECPCEKCRLEIGLLANKKIKENGIPIKEGVYEILTFLKSKGYKIGLASSSSRESVLSHLNDANILDYFEAIVCGNDIVNGKPDPEIYIKASNLLGVKTENCFAIEDSYNGIRSAHAAGMRVIMVPDMLPSDDKKIGRASCRERVLRLL